MQRDLTCNVILHGTFTYIPRGDTIQALIPKLPQHSNKAGNWLGETDLLGGVYKLIGVNGGDAKFDPAKNLIVKGGELPEHPEPHVRLIFPRPRKITSLRSADLPTEAFEHADELLTRNEKTQHVATLQIFTYDLKSDKTLRLEGVDGKCGHYWEPVLTDGHVNLHVFSSEDHPEDPVVQSGDLEACAKLLGAQLRLKRDFTYAASGIGPADPPEGVDARETESLEPRTMRMARLGRLVQQGGDANHAWCEDDALDDSPPVCGPVCRAEEC